MSEPPRYDASLLVESGYWVHSEPGTWTLARHAVDGVRVDAVPPVVQQPLPEPSYAAQWVREFDLAYQYVREFDLAYQYGTQQWVDREIRRRRALQEARDRNTAMVLWGIHL